MVGAGFLLSGCNEIIRWLTEREPVRSGLFLLQECQKPALVHAQTTAAVRRQGLRVHDLFERRDILGKAQDLRMDLAGAADGWRVVQRFRSCVAQCLDLGTVAVLSHCIPG